MAADVSIDVKDVLAVIGEYEVTVRLLRAQLAQAQAALANDKPDAGPEDKANG